MRETFLHGGQVGTDLQAVDWDRTPLGPPETWPRSLRAALRIVLQSQFSMWMAWGPELTFFCNDAYRRETLRTKYPWALGRPAREVWSEVWSEVEDRVAQVIEHGNATWDDKLQLFLERDGYREETYHTFSYSPVVDDDGAVAGLLCVVSEETEEVLLYRRTGVLRELGDRIHSPRDEAHLLEVVSDALGDDWPDLPGHLLYVCDGGSLELAGQAGWVEEASDVRAVPLVGPLGVQYGVLVVRLNPYRRFDDAYAEFLSQVGTRIGAAIAGVRSATELVAREHEVADELQSSLLPANTFDLDHLDVATYYRAGVQGTQVGGDWYDVVTLADGRTALVVGDVMGRGVRAAAVMGQLRTAIRAYSRLGLPGDELMSSLDGLVRDLFPEQVVTCVYAVFDPDACTVDFVSAGHLPLLLRTHDGSVRRVDVESHPPLGVGFAFDRVHHLVLEPGDGVLLYTDGLVERRGADLEHGIESLRALLAGADRPLADVPEWLARTLLPEGPDDDVAILLAEVPPGR